METSLSEIDVEGMYSHTMAGVLPGAFAESLTRIDNLSTRQAEPSQKFDAGELIRATDLASALLPPVDDRKIKAAITDARAGVHSLLVAIAYIHYQHGNASTTLSYMENLVAPVESSDFNIPSRPVNKLNWDVPNSRDGFESRKTVLSGRMDEIRFTSLKVESIALGKQLQNMMNPADFSLLFGAIKTTLARLFPEEGSALKRVVTTKLLFRYAMFEKAAGKNVGEIIAPISTVSEVAQITNLGSSGVDPRVPIDMSGTISACASASTLASTHLTSPALAAMYLS